MHKGCPRQLSLTECLIYLCLQSAPGLSEGQTEGNRELRVRFGRHLCELGKLGLVNPGDMCIKHEICSAETDTMLA